MDEHRGRKRKKKNQRQRAIGRKFRRKLEDLVDSQSTSEHLAERETGSIPLFHIMQYLTGYEAHRNLQESIVNRTSAYNTVRPQADAEGGSSESTGISPGAEDKTAETQADAQPDLELESSMGEYVYKHPRTHKQTMPKMA
ncbi:hypothetical protein TWF696_006747 [Orbilia brochopaga]|uniref:Uncharacterized protein n=1 Tax=Orbilia brochopaga TaxID=3140254 RepID=A0AAV9UT32_9PEZI